MQFEIKQQFSLANMQHVRALYIDNYLKFILYIYMYNCIYVCIISHQQMQYFISATKHSSLLCKLINNNLHTKENNMHASYSIIQHLKL